MLRGFLFAVKTLCRGKGEVIKMTAQIVAVAIFIIMFGLIVLDKIERQVVTLTCGAATLLLVFGL